MAQRTIVQLSDDLTGEEADTTIPFALDRAEYEIDLTSDNAEKLREVFAPYIAAARRTGGRRSTGRPAAASTSSSNAPKRSREENQQIRSWAKKQGLEVSERGRIPTEVAEAYDARELTKTPG